MTSITCCAGGIALGLVEGEGLDFGAAGAPRWQLAQARVR